MLSSVGFVWLVTNPFGRLGVIATHGACTLLVNERRQALSPNGSTEIGGIYVPAGTTHTAPAELENGILPHIGSHAAASPHRHAPRRPCAFDEHAAPEGSSTECRRAPRDFVVRRAAIHRPPSHGYRHAGWTGIVRHARGDAVPALLRERARARVDRGWVRGVGDGNVLGAVLVVFGLSGGAGCVFTVRGAKSLVAAAWLY